MSGQRNEKHKEVAVVSPAYAVVHPGAVMVEYLEEEKSYKFAYGEVKLLIHLYAIVANGTMGTPGRSVELASDAPFHPH